MADYRCMPGVFVKDLQLISFRNDDAFLMTLKKTHVRVAVGHEFPFQVLATKCRAIGPA